MSERKQYRWYIGIDCGVNTGYSIWDANERRLIDVSSCKIHTAMDNIRMLEREVLAQTFIRVEDARLRKYIPRERDIKQRVGRAKGAGSVSRDAQIWEDFLTDLGVDFEMVAPMNNRTKTTAESFKRLTGWPNKTNEHSRDSAWLVFGRSTWNIKVTNWQKKNV